MDFKRILRGPWLWIVLGVVAVLVILQILSASTGAEAEKTSDVV